MPLIGIALFFVIISGMNPADFNVFELDDHPIDHGHTIAVMRRFKRVNPNFKANLFCVPELMTSKRIHELLRLPFIRIYPHGFEHAKGECRFVDDQTLRRLDQLRDSNVFHRVFKAPRYGYSTEFLRALADRGFIAAINTLNQIDEIPPMRTYERRANELNCKDQLQYCLRHSRYPDGKAFGRGVGNGSRSSILRRFVIGYCRYLRKTDKPFAFCEDLTLHSQVKINLGCGPHHFCDWLNLDHHPADATVRFWDHMKHAIPCSHNRADLVYSSHLLNYVEDYERFFLDIWRVLRPGHIYRLEEDATDSGYRWRQTGQQHATGKIRSEPTKRSVIESLERVGFQVKETPFDRTGSGHKEVLALHTRHRRYKRGQKFVLEATKKIRINDMTRPYRDDRRAPRRGEYPYQLKDKIMIILASHKTFKTKVESSDAKAALFLCSDPKHVDEFCKGVPSDVEVIGVMMNNTQPGRRKQKQLPTVDSVLTCIMFLAKHREQKNDIVIADNRGKGLCHSFSIIANYLGHRAARKAVIDAGDKCPANGFVLKLADTILGSSLYDAAATFGKVRYLPYYFESGSFDSHIAIGKPRPVVKLKRGKRAEPAKSATTEPNVQTDNVASDATPEADKPVEAKAEPSEPPVADIPKPKRRRGRRPKS